MFLTKRTVREAGLIVGLAVVLGLAVNAPLVRRFLNGDLEDGFLASKAFPGIIQIGLAEAEDLFAGGKSLFVDARPSDEFRAGHVAGARSLPFATADERTLADFISAAGPDKEIVVYCSGGDCLSSLGLARLLAGRGLKDIRVFQGGWAEWTAAGLPGETGE
jgi:rhodanese-related sulfurtransferase